MHSHVRHCAPVGVSVHGRVDAVSLQPLVCRPLGLNLSVPLLLIDQDVRVLGPNLKFLLLGDVVPSPVGLEISEEGIAPVHEELDSEPLLRVRAITAQPIDLLSQSQLDCHPVVGRIPSTLQLCLEGEGHGVEQLVVHPPGECLHANQVSLRLATPIIMRARFVASNECWLR